MKLKEILNMSRYALSRSEESALSSMYKHLRKALKSRIKTFEKHDAIKAVPKKLRDLSLGNMSKTTLVNRIGEITNFMQGDTGTYRDYMKWQNLKKQSLENRLGVKLTDEQHDEYGRFMGAMQDRFGAIWRFDNSNKAERLYAEAIRLNLNPQQFLKNYDYWVAHVDKLEDAKPLHAKNLKPSSYIRQLHLPNIKDWEEDE